MLNLAEELLLLALQDEKGTVLASAAGSLSYGLAGALLMELALRSRLHKRKGIQRTKIVSLYPETPASPGRGSRAGACVRGRIVVSSRQGKGAGLQSIG